MVAEATAAAAARALLAVRVGLLPLVAWRVSKLVRSESAEAEVYAEVEEHEAVLCVPHTERSVPETLLSGEAPPRPRLSNNASPPRKPPLLGMMLAALVGCSGGPAAAPCGDGCSMPCCRGCRSGGGLLLLRLFGGDVTRWPAAPRPSSRPPPRPA